MKTYYYTIAEPKKAWDKTEQRKVQCKDWKEFVDFCKKISLSFNASVRGCESEGYNNQGHYFNETV